MLPKITYALMMIFSGLFAGYFVQRLFRDRSERISDLLDLSRKRIQQSVLLAVVPVTVAGSLWIIDLGGEGISTLPFLGFLHFVSGGSAALLAGHMMGLDRRGRGSLFCCGLFTNLGSLGGLTAFLFLGEQGYALVPFYKLFGEFFYYGIGFPVAKYFSPRMDTVPVSFPGMFARVFRDIYVIAALISMIVGIGMNISGIPRPSFYSRLNAVLIPSGAFLMLFAIGLRMRFGRIPVYKRECFVVLGIKFLFTPVMVVAAALLLGARSDPGLPVLPVAIILSAMPVAFTATIPPAIYGLDIDMVNSCWLLSTIALLAVLPLLSAILPFAG